MIIEAKMLVLLLTGVLMSQSLAQSSTKHPHKKVLILGAGVSGLTAAKTLMNSGINDFLILEGQDYIGGRIKQKPFAGYKIESGANWIHFAHEEDSAQIWEKKKQLNLAGVMSDYTDIIMRNEKGDNITDMASVNRFAKVLGKVEDAQEEREKLHKGSISGRIGLALLGWKPKTPADRVVEYLEVDFENGKDPKLVPFAAIFEKGSDFFITDPRGVISLYKDMYKDFMDRIILNKRITKIKYSPKGVKVTTSDGDIYTADYGLCTFSTGVLGSDMVKFSPPLPDWKKESILKSPMSVYTKIFLKFPYKFWDDKEYILMSARQRGYFPVFQDLERPGMFPKGSGMLLITVTDDEGRRIEKQSFKATKAEVVKMLRGVYGQNVPEPTDIYYSRWSLNPFTRGAYSDSSVGTVTQDFVDLGKNLGNLYFSGEAMSEDWYGYMQGAYLTSQEKAKTILKRIQCNKDGSSCPSAGAAFSLALIPFSFCVSLTVLNFFSM